MRKWLAARLEELKPLGKTKAGLARAMRVRGPAVYDMISGDRKKIKVTEVGPMANYLGWPRDRILALEGSKRADDDGVTVAGYIGAGGEIAYEDAFLKGGGVDETERPPDEPLPIIALSIRGTSQLPLYRDGDLVFYTREPPIPVAELINDVCVVKLADPDGRTLLKTIRPGSRAKRFTLTSMNADDIPDVKIEWAAPVLWVKPARRRR